MARGSVLSRYMHGLVGEEEGAVLEAWATIRTSKKLKRELDLDEETRNSTFHNLQRLSMLRTWMANLARLGDQRSQI